MARRKRTSLLEDLYQISAAVPWWAGVLLALLSYAALHWLSLGEVPKAVSQEQFAQVLIWTAVRWMAGFGQYLAPLVLLAGAAASWWGRRKRAGLVDQVAQGTPLEAIRSMKWDDFELLVGEVFRMRGFTVGETGSGADGGTDLRLRKGGEVFLVQCKQWRYNKVSVMVVRELFGVMAAEGATGGFVVTSGVFTQDARAFAKGRNIDLLDGPELAALFEKARASTKSVAPTVLMATSDAATTCTPENPTPAVPPSCPRCGTPMVKRTAKQGSNAGGTFWGCTGYPNCRGLRASE